MRCVDVLKVFPGGSVVKNPPVDTEDARDAGLILGSGRSPGGRNGSPLQYAFLENLMDKGAWCSWVNKEWITTE